MTKAAKTSSLFSRAIDLLVLSGSFLLFAYLMDFESSGQFWASLLLYVAVVFVSLRLSKRLIFGYVHNTRRITSILLGNITGLLVGALLVLMLDQVLPGIGEGALVVVFSSIMAFFILGTLSPMVKSSHNDIIHH